MAYPADQGGGGRRPRNRRRRRPLVVRRLAGVRRAANTGTSTQLNRATRRAVRSINFAQSRGTYGRRNRRAVRRTMHVLGRRNPNDLYLARRSATRLRRAVRSQNVYPGLRNAAPKPHRKEREPDFWPDAPKRQQHKRRSEPRPSRSTPRSRPPLSKQRRARKRRPGDRDRRPHRQPNRPRNKQPHKGPGPGKKKKGKKNYHFGKPGRKLIRRATNITEKKFLYANPNLIKKEVAQFRKQEKRIRKRIKGHPKKERRTVRRARKRFLRDVRNRGIGASKIYRKAGLAVSAELDPQIKAITTRIKQTKRERKRTLDDLKGLFNRALEQHRSYKQAINTGSQEEIDQTRNQFDSLVNTIAQGYDTSTQSVRDELERLDISSAAPASTESLNRDKQYATSLARTTGQESVAEQRTNVEGYNQLMSLLGGEISTTGLGARTEANQKFIDALMKYRDSRSALKATRHGKIVTAAEALKQAAAAARSEALQNQLARKIAGRDFKLDVAKFKADERERRFQRKLDLRKYDLDKAEFLAEQVRNNRKRRRPPKPRSYSNSRSGAIDYLRDYGFGHGAVDTYLELIKAADTPHLKIRRGPFGLPIPYLKNMEHNNRKVKSMMAGMRRKGVPAVLVKAYGNALRIEWGLN